MQTHTTKGAEILAGLELGGHPAGRVDRPVAPRALGREAGYPTACSGEDIPLEGRICAIADVYDALVSKRPYKDAWPMDRILEEIAQGSGSHFDPALVSRVPRARPGDGEVARSEDRHDLDLDSLPPLFEPEAEASNLTPGTRAPYGRHS